METTLLFHVPPGGIAFFIFHINFSQNLSAPPMTRVRQNFPRALLEPSTERPAAFRCATIQRAENACSTSAHGREVSLSQPGHGPHTAVDSEASGDTLWPLLHWLLVAGPVPLTGAIWKLSELLTKSATGGPCEPRAGSGY